MAQKHTVVRLWFLIVTCSCCPYLYFSSPIMWVTYFLGSWMTSCLGNSYSFGLPRVPFVNCCQYTYLVISLLVLRAGYGIWLYQFLIIAYLFTFQESAIQCTATCSKWNLQRPQAKISTCDILNWVKIFVNHRIIGLTCSVSEILETLNADTNEIV